MASGQKSQSENPEKGADKKTFVLRLSPEMYAAIEHWAQDEFRSVNAQIEYVLNQALRKQRGYKSK